MHIRWTEEDVAPLKPVVDAMARRYRFAIRKHVAGALDEDGTFYSLHALRKAYSTEAVVCTGPRGGVFSVNPVQLWVMSKKRRDEDDEDL